VKKSDKFSPEVRERVVRTVQEQREEYPSLWAAMRLKNVNFNWDKSNRSALSLPS
jgi:hypothetical protein